MKKLGFFALLLWAAAIFGECRSLYQFCTSDFEPSYKREIIYGVATFTGLGAIVGYFNIHDTPPKPIPVTPVHGTTQL